MIFWYERNVAMSAKPFYDAILTLIYGCFGSYVTTVLYMEETTLVN